MHNLVQRANSKRAVIENELSKLIDLRHYSLGLSIKMSGDREHIYAIVSIAHKGATDTNNVQIDISKIHCWRNDVFYNRYIHFNTALALCPSPYPLKLSEIQSVAHCIDKIFRSVVREWEAAV